MTHPIHGLDPNALEAALSVKLVGQFWPGETAIESEDHNRSAYRAERYAQIITAYLAALSQNPGTSKTSGEAVRPSGYFSDDGLSVLVPDDKAAEFKAAWDAIPTPPFGSKLMPFYLAALEPRASGREAVIEECAKIAERFSAGAEDDTGELPAYVLKHEIAAAIRKLSEVSHEH